MCEEIKCLIIGPIQFKHLSDTEMGLKKMSTLSKQLWNYIYIPFVNMRNYSW